MLGILHVPVAIPLIPGDAGNALSYPYPVVFRSVEGCSVAEVVGGPRAEVAPRLVATAQALVRDGARAIAGDCGTLLRFQADVAAAVGVPVLLSPLLLVPLACALVGSTRSVGVLAANAANVGADVLALAGITAVHRVVVEGLQTRPAWRAAIVEESGALDAGAIREEVVEAALALRDRIPDLGAYVFDCADLPPYGPAVQAATGLPVFDALTLADLAHAATDRSALVPAL
jgi:hypothetical protein